MPRAFPDTAAAYIALLLAGGGAYASQPTIMGPDLAMPAQAPPDAATTPSPLVFSCPPEEALPHDDPIIVCIDATKPTLKYTLDPPAERLAKPNRYFYVQVVHWADEQVQLDLGGQIGSWQPGDRGTITGPVKGFGADGSLTPSRQATVTTRTFAPRKPGFTPLTVRVLDAAGQATQTPLVIEFWIDETYAGSFRLGVAGVFFNAVDQQFAKVTRPNAQQAEIIAEDDNIMDLDVVVGYSAYLDAGGRPGIGCDAAPFCFNPYFGLGIMSASGDGDVDFLKSVHLGAEWEITPNFALALTANLRRVKRLGGDLKVGSPIAGDIPTENRFAFGMGVVINLSPDFLRIGAGGAAGVLK